MFAERTPNSFLSNEIAVVIFVTIRLRLSAKIKGYLSSVDYCICCCNLGLATRGKVAFPIFTTLIFCSMPNPTKNESMPNNSTHTSTLNCESVEILFGLTPHQLYYAAGWFFDFPRMCSVALMEMLDAIQEQSKNGEDSSTLISYLKTMRVLVNLEKLLPEHNLFVQYIRGDNPQWFDELKKTEPDKDQPDLLKTTIDLHNGLLDIVRSVDAIGYVEFASNCAGAFADITTKQAYDDIVVAFACVNTLYMAYTKNRYKCMSNKCFINQN